VNEAEQIADLRRRVDQSLESHPNEAAGYLDRLWQTHPGPPAAHFVISCFSSLRLPLTPVRLAILRSFTVEPVLPLLRAGAYVSGIDLQIQVGAFNAYVQEILDPGSPCYAFQPDIVVLAAHTRDLAPELWSGFSALSAERSRAEAARLEEHFGSLVRSFRKASKAHLVIHNLETPALPDDGLVDPQNEHGQGSIIQRVNHSLQALSRSHEGVYVLDYEGLVSRHGKEAWNDEQKWAAVRLPMSAAQLLHLAEAWRRFLVPLTGKTAKCAVVDLDNTLWGGVIGEDGMTGIQLGSEGAGAPYLAFQRALLSLYRRGILLAVCSKNNEADAMEALTKHEGMAIRPDQFAAMRLNWRPKSENLKEIADELGIGLDSLCLIDDNPVERQQVRSALPELKVLELPEQPWPRVAALMDYPAFERVRLTVEDTERGKLYAARRESRKLESGVATREDFYRSLEQVATIRRLDADTLARVSQLINKTNQFNLTTRRYTVQEVADMALRPGYRILSIQVTDRFSDNGIVGVGIIHSLDKTCEIDSFLLSCRVINRTVETAFLSHLMNRARAEGARHMQGWFIPTKKNAPAAGFYAEHGFEEVEKQEDRALWRFDLEKGDVKLPDWFLLKVVAEPANV
jgi:FkbH-like protein